MVQDTPEKKVVNYNEFKGRTLRVGSPKGAIDIKTGAHNWEEQHQLVNRGMDLVDDKVREILGDNNKLTNGDLVFPKIMFVATDPGNPNWAGVFFPDRNEIRLILDKIKDDPLDQTKVFIHEYLHFLCHNGRDEGEQVNNASPLAKNNNLGFRRNFGLDIRKGKEGKRTSDYFLSFNEAVTEQLSIDILPGVHETYSDYRGLLNQVIDDAVAHKLGSKNESGTFLAWSRQQIKNYIYSCFFRGDLGGFTKFLQNVYKKYGLSEQQFGLMTNRDDLPSVIEKKLETDDPIAPPPPPREVAMIVQRYIDRKTPLDYITDVVVPESDNGGIDRQNIYGAEYDAFVKENEIAPASRISANGRVYDVDNLGLIIFRGTDASPLLNYIRGELDKLLVELRGGNIDATNVAEQIDGLLFDKYHMSMLSDGFREFYIYKHAKLAENR